MTEIFGVPTQALFGQLLIGLINGSLLNNLGDANNRVLVPGNTNNSVMLTRLAQNNALRMPPSASSVDPLCRPSTTGA